MSLKDKILCFFSLACMIGGCMGMKDDWTFYYYVLSWIPAIAVGGGVAAIVGTNKIRACDIIYSGFVIVMGISMLFHRDTLYLVGRLIAILGATILWMISIDYADKK